MSVFCLLQLPYRELVHSLTGELFSINGWLLLQWTSTFPTGLRWLRCCRNGSRLQCRCRFLSWFYFFRELSALKVMQVFYLCGESPTKSSALGDRASFLGSARERNERAVPVPGRFGTPATIAWLWVIVREISTEVKLAAFYGLGSSPMGVL